MYSEEDTYVLLDGVQEERFVDRQELFEALKEVQCLPLRMDLRSLVALLYMQAGLVMHVLAATCVMSCLAEARLMARERQYS